MYVARMNGVRMTSELGEIVRRERNKRQWTQEELGNKVGVTGQQIHNIEKGLTQLPGPDTLGALARALGIAEAVLLRAAGYLQNTSMTIVDALVTEKDVTPAELWEAVLARHHGDREAAMHYMSETFRVATDRRPTS